MSVVVIGVIVPEYVILYLLYYIYIYIDIYLYLYYISIFVVMLFVHALFSLPLEGKPFLVRRRWTDRQLCRRYLLFFIVAHN